MEDKPVNEALQGIEHRKAKTHKGRRHLDKYKPKLNEDPRQCLILKGNKTSENVTKAMDYFVGFLDSRTTSVATSTSSSKGETTSSLSRLLRASSSSLSRTCARSSSSGSFS